MRQPGTPDRTRECRRGLRAVTWISFAVMIFGVGPLCGLGGHFLVRGRYELGAGALLLAAFLVLLLWRLPRQGLSSGLLLLLSEASITIAVEALIQPRTGTGFMLIFHGWAALHALIALGVGFELRHLSRLQRLLVEQPELGETPDFRRRVASLRRYVIIILVVTTVGRLLDF